MNKNEWDNSLLEHFALKKGGFNLDLLMEMVTEVMDSGVTLLSEEAKIESTTEEKRFSMEIPIPRLIPSEAWGDPNSQSRKQINKVFASITGGRDIRKRIESVNGFLSPETAANATSPGRIINMMMIIESLQAALNDYNASASGFVFEGFMAALTGGKQIAGKVGGTLPIEDFIAFSEMGGGEGEAVSLKLLRGKGDVAGSYTNLVDFLVLRGQNKIKYLVAYKLTKGEKVEKLNLFAFDVGTHNFVSFMENAGASKQLISGVDIADLREKFLAFSRKDSDDNKFNLASLLIQTSGYSKAGLIHNWHKGMVKWKEEGSGEEGKSAHFKPGAPDGRELTPDEQEAADASKYASRHKDYTKALTPNPEKDLGMLYSEPNEREKKPREEEQPLQESLSRLNEAINFGNITPAQAFHYVEKQMMIREKQILLQEGGGAGGSQWSASWPQIERLKSTVALEMYGEIDLSAPRIKELTEIFSDKIGKTIGSLLESVKNMSEYITEYYSEEDRSKGSVAADAAIESTKDIVTQLGEDPMSKEI
jgi:hypothetical protein